MIERIVENWLTSCNETSYQLAFCQALQAVGYVILSYPQHGPGEQGKDVIANARDGRTWAFQLKSGDIRLGEWRRIRGEVEDLVRVPARVPGMRLPRVHQSVLVTNGLVTGDARANIEEFNRLWMKDGQPGLRVWQRGELLDLFVRAQGKYLPRQLPDLRSFVNLYVRDGADNLPREDLALFLESLVAHGRTNARIHDARKALGGIALTTSYVLERYASVGNHIALAEGWTILGANILRVAEGHSLREVEYRPSLDLSWIGLERSLRALEQEVLDRTDFIELAALPAEPFVLGPRTLMVLGWLAGHHLSRKRLGIVQCSEERVAKTILSRVGQLQFLGEADWPSVVFLVLFLESQGHSVDAEELLTLWCRVIVRRNVFKEDTGFPSPYWTQERVLDLLGGFVPATEQENFTGKTYTLMGAMDMLVRRLRRNLIARIWPNASRAKFCEYFPRGRGEWFRWRSRCGTNVLNDPEQPRSWKLWREEASTYSLKSLPRLLRRHPEWIHPILQTYPHRLTRSVTAFMDGWLGERCTKPVGKR